MVIVLEHTESRRTKDKNPTLIGCCQNPDLWARIYSLLRSYMYITHAQTYMTLYKLTNLNLQLKYIYNTSIH